MREHYDEQLAQLNNELITMGAMCEEAIGTIAKLLESSDEKLKNLVFRNEKQIDEKERDIESLCLKLILKQQPVASDLRLISSALRMISDLERIGDQCADIADISEYVTSTKLKVHTHIYDMAKASISMVTDSVESFVKQDIEMARKTISVDDKIDDLFNHVKEILIDAIKAGDEDAEMLVDLLMIAKYFERIGDHAENVAESVIFSITGER
ncbi:MAG: phosphate signaling complex protein PhoU [Oscillospiraceae bacterium]